MSIRYTDIAARTVWTPAPEKTTEEYQDAFFPPHTGEHDGARGATRFCIADGASKSGYARQWARLLVEEWGRNPDQLTFQSSLTAASAKWDAWCADRESQRPKRVLIARDWFQDTFPEDFYAYATLLVVQVYPGRYPRWFGLAVGDTFVFHVRANDLITSMPKLTWGRTMPPLISTRRHTDGDDASCATTTGEPLAMGDELFLSTDAMGRWIFSCLDAGRPPWDLLRTGVNRGQLYFRDWIDGLRAADEIENDDITLMRVTFGS